MRKNEFENGYFIITYFIKILMNFRLIYYDQYLMI
jgi:hypothetical protein